MNDDPSIPPSQTCRLCGAVAEFAFQKNVLGRHRIAYFKCVACGSMQTQRPTWLEEAYSLPGLHIDVGAPSRSVKNWLAATTLLQALGFPSGTRGIDFGAGPGLFSGLMRSVGYDFYSYDAYMPPQFSSYFHLREWSGSAPKVITAFEVFEHLPEPAQTLDQLLSQGAGLILFTTWPVDGQPDDWIYFLPECGQHVFFYSTDGLRDRAAMHGYRILVSMYFYILFDPERLTKDQVQTIEEFSNSAVGLVAARIPDLLSSIIMGNAFIDADFAASSAIFTRMIDATTEERATRFGPALS